MPVNTRSFTESLNQKKTSVTNSVTALPVTPSRKSQFVQNLGAAVIYVGDSDVTASNGVKMEVGDEKEFICTDSVTIYAITPSGTADVRTLEVK